MQKLAVCYLCNALRRFAIQMNFRCVNFFLAIVYNWSIHLNSCVFSKGLTFCEFSASKNAFPSTFTIVIWLYVYPLLCKYSTFNCMFFLLFHIDRRTTTKCEQLFCILSILFIYILNEEKSKPKDE